MKHDKIMVIKLGGHAMDAPEQVEAFLTDVADLKKRGFRIVIAHGGGPHINQLMKRLNKPGKFHDGLRVTDEETLEIVEMALCGAVNKDIVRRLAKLGVRAAGISGEDDNMIAAETVNPELGLVGSVTGVNPEIIEILLQAEILPVIAPLGLDSNNDALNINADTAAGAIAGALKADYFILVSDVPGILDGNGQPITRIASERIRQLRENGVITGGMLPKTECCLKALAAGCKNALILDGSKKNALPEFVNDGKISGTLIENGRGS